MAAVLLIVAVGHVADAPPASACSCGALGGPDDGLQFAEATAVFVGEVLDYSAESEGSFDAVALWRFRVEHVYKGRVAERQGVVSAVKSPACGLNVPMTGRVVVFATRPPEGFTSIDGADLYAPGCSGSGAIESLGALTALGDPVPPRPGVGGPVTLDQTRGRAGTLAVALMLASVLLLVTQVRRKWRVPRRSQAGKSVER